MTEKRGRYFISHRELEKPLDKDVFTLRDKLRRAILCAFKRKTGTKIPQDAHVFVVLGNYMLDQEQMGYHVEAWVRWG